ncbi:hypothetical protein LXA43DRAFT_579225 [Ganoderma leucocontextum]|nr:hypothetical protein LXA43DRAFT_579225 [Ganoderma leucocontextum]
MRIMSLLKLDIHLLGWLWFHTGVDAWAERGGSYYPRSCAAKADTHRNLILLLLFAFRPVSMKRGLPDTDDL